MKLKAVVPALLFVAASSLSVGALAADADKATTEAPAQKMKPHSHMQEKTGIAPKDAAPAAEQKADAAKSNKPRADKDKARHLHPRDGK